MTVLVPVLELTAGTFATQDRALPEGCGATNPAGWLEHWRASLADSGIAGLTPLAEGHDLVPLSQLTDAPVVRAILRKALEDMTDWNLEELGSLSGGYVLRQGDAVIPPGCCGDLGSLHDWTMAAEHLADTWQMVWIGHPWTHVRAYGDMLHFAQPSERDASESLEEALRVPRERLRAAIATAERERDRFGQSLTTLIDELAPRVPTQDVVDVLLHGHR